MTQPTYYKYCFKHRTNGKMYVVGALDRDNASHMVAEICGDYNFDETDLPPGHDQ